VVSRKRRSRKRGRGRRGGRHSGEKGGGVETMTGGTLAVALPSL